jgi:hypothetical protein
MTKKERIHAEIERLNEASLDEVYALIQRLTEAEAATARKPGVLSRLQRIKINAPEDFAANLDLYLSGEKQLASSEDSG